MRRILDAIWSFVEFIVVFYFVIVTLCVLCKNNRGYTQVGPFIFASVHEEDVNNIYDSKIGDLLIVKEDDRANINDRIYYYFEVSGKSYIYTDVVDSYDKGAYSIRTAGTALSEEYYIGRRFNFVHNLGDFLDVVKTKSGYMLYVLFPLILIIIIKVVDITIKSKNNKKEDNLKIEEVDNIKDDDNKLVDKIEDNKITESEEQKEDINNDNKDDGIDLGNMIEDNIENIDDEIL